MTHWSWAFSLPHEPADARLFDAIANPDGTSVAEWLVSAYRDELTRTSEGLADFLLGWTKESTSLAAVWHPAFGRARCLLKGRALDPTEVAARLATRIAESGHPGAWSAHLPDETMLVGATVVPDAESLELSADGRRVEVTAHSRTAGRRTVTYDVGSGTSSAEGLESLRDVGVGRPVHVLPDYALPGRGSDPQRFVGPGSTPLTSITDDIVEAFRQAMATLETHAPGYLAWVERVLCGVVVCPVETGFRVVSGSGEDAPGVIHASWPVSYMDIAEMLVHECAHQYFYLLERVGPVDDGSDPELYWSPPIRTNRPISRVLMAYHALGNILLFYDLVRGKGHDEAQYVDANEEAITGALLELDAPLRGNSALTELGRGLYEPLAQRLTAVSASLR